MLHLLLFARTTTSNIHEQQLCVVVILQATPKSTLQRSDWICGELPLVIWSFFPFTCYILQSSSFLLRIYTPALVWLAALVQSTNKNYRWLPWLAAVVASATLVQ